MDSSPPITGMFAFEDLPTASRISTPLSVLLEKLDAIPSSTIPSGFIRNTKLMNSLYSKKQQQIDVIMGEFAELYSHPINWLTLFEQRMIASGNTLTLTQSEHFQNVLDFYLQFKIAKNENRIAAKSLLVYLETHTADPDNSLIGLTPSKSVLENLQTSPSTPPSEEERAKLEGSGGLSRENSGGGLNRSDSNGSGLQRQDSGGLPRSESTNSFASNFTTVDLIEMILRWDEMTDDDAATCLHQFAASVRNHSSGASAVTIGMARAISSPSLLRTSSSNSLTGIANLSHSSSPPPSPTRQPSYSLFPGIFKKSMEIKIEKTTPWKEGDIVVVFVGMVSEPNNREVLQATIKKDLDEAHVDSFMFARVSDPCIDAEQSVGVFIDKQEQKTRVVSRESVFKYKFQQATPAMVADLTQDFFGQLTKKLAEKTNLFLASQNVDLPVLERALANEAKLFDMPTLHKNVGSIHSLQILDSIAWTNFLDTVRGYSETRAKSFLAEVESTGKIFALSRKQLTTQLNNFDYAAITTARLQSYLTSCQATIENLKTQQEKLLDGTAKQALSEWYLDHIKECVDSFLVRSGFELDVIPENYIDQAPKDLALVNKNWAMVRELLDVIGSYNTKTHYRHEVIDVMTGLMDDIYSRLDEFVRDALFVVSDRLGVTRTFFEVADNQEVYDECCKLFKEKSGNLDADLADKLDELMKDVEYIFRIREMEGFEDKKSLDHVPISGLIASRFFRLENELRTSLDVWDPNRLNELNPNVASCADNSANDTDFKSSVAVQ